MGVIFAVGGGEIRNLETLEIDKAIVRSARKECPRALFIPTASNDSAGYIETFNSIYGGTLKCSTDVLLLVNGNTKFDKIQDKIMSADIIYVGGGNTKMMLEVWKNYGVDTILAEAYKANKILSGLSAGSICWFSSGHSDSESFDSDKQWSYIKVDALGLIDAIHCPHYNELMRAEDFNQIVLKGNQVGIAIENNCAIEFKDSQYKVHKSAVNANAYKVYNLNGTLVKTPLENTTEYRSVYELLKNRQ